MSDWELKQRLDAAEWSLRNAGFRRCDIPACNCNSWHQVGGYAERFREIKEAVEEAGYSTNGKILLDVIKEILASTPPTADRWRWCGMTRNGLIILERTSRLSVPSGPSIIAEIIGPDGRVHYRRPPNDPAVEEARGTPGYTVRFVEESTSPLPAADQHD